MAVVLPPINPLGLETANQGPGFQPDGIILRKKSADRAAPVSPARGFFLSDAEGDDQVEPGHGQAYNRKAEADVKQWREPPRVGFIPVGFIWVLLDSHTK